MENMKRQNASLEHYYRGLIHSFKVSETDQLYRKQMTLRAVALTECFNMLSYAKIHFRLNKEEQVLINRAISISISAFNRS